MKLCHSVMLIFTYLSSPVEACCQCHVMTKQGILYSVQYMHMTM